MSEFVPVLDAADLPPGACREVLAGGRPVALFNVAGTFHAISNTCLHRGGPLGQGVLDGTTVLCPWHAWSFDVTTGVSTVNPDLRLQRYEVRVESGRVLVQVG
jgi:nitrite reductase/ring-hydroxylating ferredoxin subunit